MWDTRALTSTPPHASPHPHHMYDANCEDSDDGPFQTPCANKHSFRRWLGQGAFRYLFGEGRTACLLW
jgi:hypothetical protein